MKNMNANTFKLMTETLASLTYVILQNNFDRDDLKKAQETTEKLLSYMKAMGD